MVSSHLSAPRGSSVNDSIPGKQCTVTYSSFDSAVEIVARLGRGALMGKVDIKSAFRLLPVSPEDFESPGICFDGLYYYDRCLPMGGAVSCSTFECFSTFLEFCTRQAIELFLKASETDQRGDGCTISIPEVNSETCPVKAALRYLEMRPKGGEAFFCSYGTISITTYKFGTIVKRCMEYSGLPAAKFSSHSFRIGAATTAAMTGFSDAQFQHMGRWAFVAHLRYIRLDMVI